MDGALRVLVDRPSAPLDLALRRPLPATVPSTELAVVRNAQDVFVASGDVATEETRP